MARILREINPGEWNYKPYEARVVLKSIRHWQNVIYKPELAKKPLAYYANRMKFWTPENIAKLNEIAGNTEILAHDEFLYNGEVFECLGRDEGMVWYDDYKRGSCAPLIYADPTECRLV